MSDFSGHSRSQLLFEALARDELDAAAGRDLDLFVGARIAAGTSLGRYGGPAAEVGEHDALAVDGSVGDVIQNAVQDAAGGSLGQAFFAFAHVFDHHTFVELAHCFYLHVDVSC